MANGSREKFINEIKECIEKFNIELSPEALAYLESLEKGSASIGGFTENGLKILAYMQEYYTSRGNSFKAKEIGEGLFMSGRSASGSMRKLIADGYVEKIGQNPVCYGLTDLGKSYELDK